MKTPSNHSPKAGGFFFAISIMASVIIGGLLNQPSIGFLAGIGIGLSLAIMMWLLDRRR